VPYLDCFDKERAVVAVFVPSELDPGVNFINVLLERFWYEILALKITRLCFKFEIFLRQNISAKCKCKMLMKLTPWVNFTNIIHAASMHADPKSTKKQSSHQCLFSLLGSARKKSAQKMLMKLTPDFFEVIKCRSDVTR